AVRRPAAEPAWLRVSPAGFPSSGQGPRRALHVHHDHVRHGYPLRPVQPSRHAAERRLVIVVGAVVFVDTMFYAAIAPLLPGLAHSLHLSKLSAGVMTAAYPLGTLVAALPGGLPAVRVGPKRTVYAGLGLLAGAPLPLGLL